MDILISANLERLLYHTSGNDEALINDLMSRLAKDGVYKISDEMLSAIREHFDAGFADEAEVRHTIQSQCKEYNYLLDTHTAVAVNVYYAYVKRTGDDIPTVIDSTASPFKFPKSVYSAVFDGAEVTMDEFETVEEINKVLGAEIPEPIKALKNKKVRFTDVCSKEDMSEMVFKLLKI
jgi:threonine synthase